MLIFKLTNASGHPLIKGGTYEMYFTNIGKVYDFISELLGYNILYKPVVNSLNETIKSESFRLKLPNILVENTKYIVYYESEFKITFVVEVFKIN